MWTLLRIGAVLVLLSAGGASSAPLSANDTATPAGAHKFRKIKTGSAEGVVVPAAPDDKQAWTPDDKSVRAFEEGLPASLQKKKPSEEPNLHSKLDQFKRQYLGKVQRGRRILYVIFACQTAPDWEDTVRITKDGGSCYFQIKYDPAKRTYSEPNINHPS